MAKKMVNLNKLDTVYAKIPEDKKPIAKDLIDEILFMGEVLAKIKKAMREQDLVVNFEQGVQKMKLENPLMKTYNTTIQRYGSIYKQLCDMMPKEESKIDEDDFDDFLKGSGKG